MASDTADTDVVIAGAGPTGLMAAILLQRCGLRVRILDKSEQQAHESRAFALQARSLELLESIGLAETFLKRGLIAPGVQIVVNGQVRAELNIDDLGADDTPYSFVFFLPQSEIETLLLEELQRRGVSVERRTEVMGFEQDDNGVLVRTNDGTIRAEFLIGADGAHSVVRRKLGFSFEGAAYEQTFLLADCEIEWPLDYQHLKLFMRGSALGLYFPLRGERFGRVIAVQNRSTKGDSAAAQEATTAEDVTLDEVEAAFRAATGPHVRLTKAVWTSRYRIHHRAANSYGRGRVFIAGDAAHIHSPAGGQGMNTGLQDAANLAWKVAVAVRGGGAPALLRSYHGERWPVGQLLLAFTDRIFDFASSPRGMAARLRNQIAPRVMSFVSKTSLRYKAFRFVSQLGIRYEPSAFIRGDGAGRRAPNGRIARHKDVFDLLKGYRFHVLALSRKPLSRDEIARTSAALASVPKNIGLGVETHLIAHSLSGDDPRVLQAESSDVFVRYGLGRDDSAIFLVRPDGYIAYRSDGLWTDGLVDFLGKLSA